MRTMVVCVECDRPFSCYEAEAIAGFNVCDPCTEEQRDKLRRRRKASNPPDQAQSQERGQQEPTPSPQAIT